MVNGAKIKELRESNGITLLELGKAVYATEAMISYIENGIRSPSVELLKRIADYFGVSMEDLLKEPNT